MLKPLPREATSQEIDEIAQAALLLEARHLQGELEDKLEVFENTLTALRYTPWADAVFDMKKRIVHMGSECQKEFDTSYSEDVQQAAEVVATERAA